MVIRKKQIESISISGTQCVREFAGSFDVRASQVRGAVRIDRDDCESSTYGIIYQPDPSETMETSNGISLNAAEIAGAFGWSDPGAVYFVRYQSNGDFARPNTVVYAGDWQVSILELLGAKPKSGVRKNNTIFPSSQKQTEDDTLGAYAAGIMNIDQVEDAQNKPTEFKMTRGIVTMELVHTPKALEDKTQAKAFGDFMFLNVDSIL